MCKSVFDPARKGYLSTNLYYLDVPKNSLLRVVEMLTDIDPDNSKEEDMHDIVQHVYWNLQSTNKTLYEIVSELAKKYDSENRVDKHMRRVLRDFVCIIIGWAKARSYGAVYEFYKDDWDDEDEDEALCDNGGDMCPTGSSSPCGLAGDENMCPDASVCCTCDDCKDGEDNTGGEILGKPDFRYVNPFKRTEETVPDSDKEESSMSDPDDESEDECCEEGGLEE